MGLAREHKKKVKGAKVEKKKTGAQKRGPGLFQLDANC
jgi:hypothetical protein